MSKVQAVKRVDIDEKVGQVHVQVKGEVISQDDKWAYVLDPEKGYVELPLEFLEHHNKA